MRWHVASSIPAGDLVLRFTWFVTPAGLPDGDKAVFDLKGLPNLLLGGALYRRPRLPPRALGFWLFGIGGVILKSTTLPIATGDLAIISPLAQTVLDDAAAKIVLLPATIACHSPDVFRLVSPYHFNQGCCLSAVIGEW